MMTARLVALLLLVASVPLRAEIKFPINSFDAAELAAAQEKAAKDNKSIAFIYTDKDTTCGLCQSATAEIIQEFRGTSVIVYVRSTGDVPSAVGEVLSSRGKFIPKVALFTADLSKSHGLVTYEEIKAGGDKPLRELKRAARG